MIDEALAAVGLTANLDAPSADAIRTLASFVAWPEQEILFREGEVHRRLYWVHLGRIRLEMSGAHAGSKAILTVGPGDILAWSTLLGDGRMTTSAVPMTATTLLAFDAESLRQLCESNHDVGYRVMTTVAASISKRLLATRLQLLDLFHHPPGAPR
ncbi:Crp/Fnr family transcriptional regulator [Roseiconus nitratireducens]|nr:cyclic nucleotide-binding domain-containing protein [Roseiconus nitratireducens]